MGYIRHNAIVVTSWSDEEVELAATFATNIGLAVLGPSNAVVNNYRSFLVPPDGSKEGWPESCDMANKRAELMRFLRGRKYEDGSSPLEWCEIAYGSDDGNAEIVAHTWSAKP